MSRCRPAGSSRRRGGDRGAADALGIALVAPAAIGLAVVILFLGRQVDSRATVQSAAEAAAQAAAQERSPADAIAAAHSVGNAMLIDELTCRTPVISVDVSAFHAPTDPTVSVSVTCSTSAAGLELLGGDRTTSSTAVAFATIDPFRRSDG